MEVAELRKKKESDIQGDNPVPAQNTDELNEKGSGMTSLSAPALSNGGRDSTTLKMPTMPGSSALDLVKKKLQESGAPVTSVIPASGHGNLDVNGSKTGEAAFKGFQSENTKDKPKDTDGNMSDSSSDSDDSDSGPTMGERITQFKVCFLSFLFSCSLSCFKCIKEPLSEKKGVQEKQRVLKKSAQLSVIQVAKF